MVVTLLSLLASGSAQAQVEKDDPLRPMSPALIEAQAQLYAAPERAQGWPAPTQGDTQAVQLRILLADAERRRGRWQAALEWLQAAEADARRLESPEPLLATLEARAQVLLEYIQFDACLATIDSLQTLAEQRGLAVWHGRALALRGNYWRRLGDYQQSMSAHLSALDLRERSNDRFGHVDSINAISLLRRRGGELYLALDGHTKALRIAEEIGYEYAVSESQRLIARVYNELDDFELAERFYRAALQSADPENDLLRSDVLLELASVLVQQKQLDAAEAFANEAIEIGEQSQGERYNGVGYLRRAQILAVRGQPEEALRWIEEAIKRGQNSDGARTIMVKRAQRLRMLQQLKRHAEAVTEGEFVVRMAQDVGDRLVERDALKLYAEALSGTGNPDAAFKAMARYSQLSEEVASSMTSRRIADLEASLKRRALESDLALAEKDRDLSRLESERQRLVLVAAAGVGFALLAALITVIARIRRMLAINQLLRNQSDLLKRASETDALTGLPNRRGAVHAYESMAPGESDCVVVMLLDIDHFKRINDEQGHAGGDDVLREIARRLLKLMPAGFTAARWGGEEFLILGSRPAANVDAEMRQLANALLEAIRGETMIAAQSRLTVTTSIGVTISLATAAPGSRRWEALLHAADVALYQAKVSGRDRVEFAVEPA